MAQPQADDARTGPAPTGEITTAWRLFQVVAFLAALSWLVSYVLFVDGYTALTEGLGEGFFGMVGGVVYGLSPIVSILLLGIAFSPESFAFLDDRNWTAWVTRAVIFLVPFLWMANVLLGSSPMVDKLFTVPLEQSQALPVYGGVFLHVMFQHWFQGLAAITIALVPEKFAALTESPTPAGLQCAVVDCE